MKKLLLLVLLLPASLYSNDKILLSTFRDIFNKIVNYDKSPNNDCTKEELLTKLKNLRDTNPNWDGWRNAMVGKMHILFYINSLSVDEELSSIMTQWARVSTRAKKEEYMQHIEIEKPTLWAKIEFLKIIHAERLNKERLNDFMNDHFHLIKDDYEKEDSIWQKLEVCRSTLVLKKVKHPAIWLKHPSQKNRLNFFTKAFELSNKRKAAAVREKNRENNIRIFLDQENNAWEKREVEVMDAEVLKWGPDLDSTIEEQETSEKMATPFSIDAILALNETAAFDFKKRRLN